MRVCSHWKSAKSFFDSCFKVPSSIRGVSGVEFRFRFLINVNKAMAAALINSTVISIIIAVIAYGVLHVLGFETIPVWALVVISLLAGMISGLILIGVMIVITFRGFRRGIDPDNLVGPLVTVTGDLFSIFALLFTAKIILVIIT